MCNINYPKFLCKICAKNVHDKGKAVQCDLCEFWIRIRCNNLNCLDYRYLQNCGESQYCIACCSTIFPLNSLSGNKNLWLVVLTLVVTSHATPENTNDPEKICSSKYYDIEEMHNIEIPNKNKSLSLFHINAYSLDKNFDDL